MSQAFLCIFYFKNELVTAKYLRIMHNSAIRTIVVTVRTIQAMFPSSCNVNFEKTFTHLQKKVNK